MSNLAIIPARGGSKRILNKNIKEFLGKPIIAYSIEAALNSKLFSYVMVSTDSKEIADISQKYGAEVPVFRSKKNSDDYSILADVIKEAYKSLGNIINDSFDNICCILPTAPLISEQRIREGFELLKDDKTTSVTPVVAFSYPIWRSLRINEQKLEMVWPEYLKTRSQDLPKIYHDVGAFYWLKTKSFLKEENLFTHNNKPLILKETEVQDIDTIEDWKLAELKYKLLYGKK